MNTNRAKQAAMEAAYSATEKQFARARLLQKGAAAMLTTESVNTGELEVVYEALGEAIRTTREAESTRHNVKEFHAGIEPAKRKPRARKGTIEK